MKIHIPHFDKARVLVVGDVMLDRYWHGGAQGGKGAGGGARGGGGGGGGGARGPGGRGLVPFSPRVGPPPAPPPRRPLAAPPYPAAAPAFWRVVAPCQ